MAYYDDYDVVRHPRDQFHAFIKMYSAWRFDEKMKHAVFVVAKKQERRGGV
jgi:hypothetical protein